jgi:hypothetical protein
MPESKHGPLPRRDFVLIPLISLLTALVMLGGAEWLAGRHFEESQQGNCGTPNPVHPGFRYAPNCAYYNKAAEGPLVKYEFNGCGYRNREACGPAPSGTLRIALLGASTALGFKVDFEHSLAEQARQQLAQSCGRPVEFQNMGVAGYKPINAYWRLPEALALQPDLVMLVLTPYELVERTDPSWLENRQHPELLRRPAPGGQQAGGGASEGLLARLSKLASASRAMLAAQYFLFQDRARYVEMFLMHGDKADYLRTPLPPAWEQRLAELDLLLGEMTQTLNASKKPFVVLFTPQRVQAALLDAKIRPPDVDPAALGQRLRSVLERRGIVFIDTLDAFRAEETPEALFYPVDGHMTPHGHQVVGQALAHGLIEAHLPGFEQCSQEGTL